MAEAQRWNSCLASSGFLVKSLAFPFKWSNEQGWEILLVRANRIELEKMMVWPCERLQIDINWPICDASPYKVRGHWLSSMLQSVCCVVPQGGESWEGNQWKLATPHVASWKRHPFAPGTFYLVAVGQKNIHVQCTMSRKASHATIKSLKNCCLCWASLWKDLFSADL